MGFGILFLGYCITYIISLPIGVPARLVGYLIMIMGCRKLSEYSDRFKLTTYSAILLSVTSAMQSVALVFDFLYQNLLLQSDPIPQAIDSVLKYADIALVLVFHILLLLGIRSLAKETEVDKIEAASIRNLFFVCLYFFLIVFSYIPLPIKEAFNKYLGLPLFLLNLAWIILNVILIFKCYANICDESDVEMEQKPSRFEFVNKYRAELAERQRIADEKYAKKAEEKRKNKKNKK